MKRIDGRLENVRSYLRTAGLVGLLCSACGGEPFLAEDVNFDNGQSESFAMEASRCEAVEIDEMRSLVVTDPEVLERFSLRRVLSQLVRLARVDTTAGAFFQQWWSTQRERQDGDSKAHPFCGDERDPLTGEATINGFPITCPRAESVLERAEPESHIPVALVNRFDLVPRDGSHCGEYRIVYAKNGTGVAGGRNLVIFEGVLPNPEPSCGVAACRPVAEFWQRLSDVSQVRGRARALEGFYFRGTGDFPAVVRPEHYGMAKRQRIYGGPTGQIRTNQFIQAPWTLREFSLQRVCVSNPESNSRLAARRVSCELLAKQVRVANNPYPGLWDSSERQARRFQSSFVRQLSNLLPEIPDINLLGMATVNAYNAGESIAQAGAGVNRYEPNARFAFSIERSLRRLGEPWSTDLTADLVGTRATSQSCGGCHQESSGDDLGQDLTWPVQSPSFVHIDENSQLSSALTMEGGFLDHRTSVLKRYLELTCRDDCRATLMQRDSTGSLSWSDTERASDSEDSKASIGGSVTH